MNAPTPLPVYFAYGSNLDPEQMGARCPGHKVLCRAILHDHALVVRGHSRSWGGAVATVEHAPGSMVHGVVFELTPGHYEALDHYEGYLGPQHPDNFYDRVRRTVQLELNEPLEVETYVMRPRPSGLPSRRYRWAILDGMRRHSLAAVAMQAIEATPVCD
jgi:gamma-glutamylcyclotransferase (GGCT)/AIG2-like uncharacterized protein YtfP